MQDAYPCEHHIENVRTLVWESDCLKKCANTSLGVQKRMQDLSSHQFDTPPMNMYILRRFMMRWDFTLIRKREISKTEQYQSRASPSLSFTLYATGKSEPVMGPCTKYNQPTTMQPERKVARKGTHTVFDARI